MEIMLREGRYYRAPDGTLPLDIVMKGTNTRYRVGPGADDEMFPFAANNLVVQGRADWVERKEQTVVEKAKEALSDAKQAVHNAVETASIRRNTRTAARPRAQGRVIIETGT